MEEMEHLNNRVSVGWLGLVPGQALWIRGPFEALAIALAARDGMHG